MNQRQAFLKALKEAPDLNYRERAALRLASVGRWSEIEEIINDAATEKMQGPVKAGFDWVALLTELMPLIIKYFFNR